MKLFQQTEDATNERKFMKSQVEKCRRERMNRSLERLRAMLLQEPRQPGATHHRVEKAEILEHTVLFLQNTAKGEETRASAAASPSSDGGGDGGGGRKHSLRDGFSTCLQTAAQFLGPEGKGLWLGAALDASLAVRLSRSDSDPAGLQRRTGEGRSASSSASSSLPRTKSILRMLRQKSKHRLHAPDLGAAHPYRLPVQQGFPRVPQQARIPLEMRRASKQSPAESRPASQTLWRPWP